MWSKSPGNSDTAQGSYSYEVPPNSLEAAIYGRQSLIDEAIGLAAVGAERVVPGISRIEQPPTIPVQPEVPSDGRSALAQAYSDEIRRLTLDLAQRDVEVAQDAQQLGQPINVPRLQGVPEQPWRAN